MIKLLVTEDGRHAPVVLCDACGERITQAREAMIGNKDEAASAEPGSYIDIYHFHKGACDDRLQQKLGDAIGQTDELITHFSDLAHNVKLTGADIAEWQEIRKEYTL